MTTSELDRMAARRAKAASKAARMAWQRALAGTDAEWARAAELSRNVR